jgi:hypothetical protein
MMMKYVSKFAMDILPSVVATIIGAYIVNHYIATNPAADAPVAAAASSVDPKKAAAKSDAKPSEPSGDVANLREPGVKAKGISEKAILEKTAAERPAAVEKPTEKSADKPADTASIPAETRRHQPAPREKAIAKVIAAPVPAVVPVIAAPNTVPPVEAAVAPEEHRDANDLARAAIERLRGAGDGSPRAQEATRIPDAPHVPDSARVPDGPRVPDSPRVVSAPPVRPLPPPIMVSTPGVETFDAPAASSQMTPPYAGSARIDDPGRPIPPADIPEASRPLDLRAEVVEPARREHTTVAEDMLSAAKSVFHAVLPK